MGRKQGALVCPHCGHNIRTLGFTVVSLEYVTREFVYDEQHPEQGAELATLLHDQHPGSRSEVSCGGCGGQLGGELRERVLGERRLL